MLKKRVIFTLLYDNGSFMLSRNFRLQKVGDLQWLRKNYNFSHTAFSIDELIILDVTRGKRNKVLFYEHVRSLNEECFVPIAAGGGVRTLEDARKLLYSGADKVVVNTLLFENIDIITEISKEFGSQCIVVSVDVKFIDGQFSIWTNNGTVRQRLSINKLLEVIKNISIGELYLNSINQDGTGNGYQTELLEYIPDLFQIPVILSGGAGKHSHFLSVLSDNRIDAVSTAHLFNFVGNGLEEARKKLLIENFDLATWDILKSKELKGCL
jgi:cyclase